MADKKRVLFVCMANSCRSQMAQGWASSLREDIDAYSAGIMKARLSQRTVEAMAAEGVDISGHWSKTIDELGGIDFDYVITLCDNARRQCPDFGPGTKLLHRAFADPSAVLGTDEQMRGQFRFVSGQIREFIESLELE